MVIGVFMSNCSNGTLGGGVSLSEGTGYVIENCHDIQANGLQVNVGYGKPRKLAGRNALCPCGSGKKYKKCHLGKSMSTAIKSSNSSTTFKDTLAVSSGDGIVLDNDRSSFEGTKIFAGVSEQSINSIITRLGLPENTPPELVLEAVSEISATGNVSIVERSRLKSWLLSAANFDIAGWAGVALAIASMAVPK
jgi:hypothetical protein